MNIFSKITWVTMKRNKVRTLVTIVGVILSAAMFTAVTTFCASLMNFLEKTYTYTDGDYHVGVIDVDAGFAQELKADDRTALFWAAKELGYASGDTKNEDKPYLYVMAAQEDFLKSTMVHLISGRLPENGQEVILPEHLERNGAVEYAQGDVITLQVGQRESEGLTLKQNTPYTSGKERIVEAQERTYTVTGFYERPAFEDYFAPGYTALTWYNGELAQEERYNIYVKIDRPGRNFKSYMEDYNLYEMSCKINNDVLAMSGEMQYSNIQRMINFLAIIFLGLIFLGSVALIYSAFSISVSERTKQFGLLSSVGATSRQLGRSVVTEALTVAAIGTPLGIGAGIAGMGVTLYLFGEKFHSIMVSPYDVELVVSWQAVLSAAVIGLVTVLASAWIPSRRAMRVTAMEAIRQSQDISAGGKTVRISKSFYRLFGLEGCLARKYFKRSRKKYRATIFSLAMSIMLFVSASSFSMYLKVGAQSGYGAANYDIKYDKQEDLMNVEQLETLRPQLMEADGVTDMSYRFTRPAYGVSGGNQTTAEYQQRRARGQDWDMFKGERCQLYYLDDSTYSKLLAANGLEPGEYLGQENPKAIVLNTVSGAEYLEEDGSQKRVTYNMEYLKKGTEELSVIADAPSMDGYHYIDIFRSGEDEGELCYYYVPEENWSAVKGTEVDEDGRPIDALAVPVETETIQVGALIDKGIMGVDRSPYPGIIFPASTLQERDMVSLRIFFTTDDHEASMKSLEEIMDTVPGGKNGYFTDILLEQEDRRNIETLIKVFSYGFIGLISLIAVANVFNTISTNIALRRRDYCMLQSIGMSDKGLRRMMDYECLIYGSISLLIGLPLSVLFTYLTYRVVDSSVNMGFMYPWGAAAVAAGSVFLVVFATMLYAMRKVEKENLVEVMKNENL